MITRMVVRGRPIFFVLALSFALIPEFSLAQVSYVARFAPAKQEFLLGEPIFLVFAIQNTGTRTFTIAFRSPSRLLNRELEQEPRFRVWSESGGALPDAAPRPCGGAKGSAVYGSATLAPGQSHAERWLLDEWVRFSKAGRYRVRAERRLPLRGVDERTSQVTATPVAYALAMNEISISIDPSTGSDLERAFQPYLKALEGSATRDLHEPVLVLTTLPKAFFFEKLAAMARARASESRWDRLRALGGLARLGSPAAWQAIEGVARGRASDDAKDGALRAYAIQLLSQKGDAASLPVLLDVAARGTESLRGDALRALGYFRHPRANHVLFEKLHSPSTDDRMNAILGLKNLESRDAIPALLAMLSDPAAQVRQVAHFALQGLTGKKIRLSARATPAESARLAAQWRAWWRAQAAHFVPRRQPPCRDW